MKSKKAGKTAMTPRERAMTALKGGRPDKTPFVTDVFPPPCTIERELRNRGMCLCGWTSACASQHAPRVKTESVRYKDENGRDMVKTIHTTPYGQLSSLEEPAGYTTWRREYLFKSPEDYKKIVFLIQNTVLETRYENVNKLLLERGGGCANGRLCPLCPAVGHHVSLHGNGNILL